MKKINGILIKGEFRYSNDTKKTSSACCEEWSDTEPEAKVGLQFWILHPRKGCSRGVYIEEVKEHEVGKVIEHLKESKRRNNDRFSKL